MATEKSQQRFPFFSAVGTAKEVGRKYGEFFKKELQQRAENSLSIHCETHALSYDKAFTDFDLIIRDCKNYVPGMLDEIEGTALGSGIEFYEALVLRVFYNYKINLHGGCSSLAISAFANSTGKTIAGQNKDIPPERDNEAVIFNFAVSGKPRIMNYGYYGKFEGPGFNDNGLTRFDNSLYTKLSNLENSIEIPVAKKIFKECSSISEVEEWCKKLKIENRLGFNASFTFSDKTGRVAVIEFVPGCYRIIEGDDGIIYHANNIMHNDLAQCENIQNINEWKDSFSRTKRMAFLLNKNKSDLEIDMVKKVFKDHENHPHSLCRHTTNNITAASIICIPEDLRMLVSRGTPCANCYEEYVMH